MNFLLKHEPEVPSTTLRLSIGQEIKDVPIINIFCLPYLSNVWTVAPES